MKRSLRPQIRTTSKSQQPFEPDSWPSCPVGRETSCQHCMPTAAAYQRAPRKRSHSRQNIMNQSFKFCIFLEKKTKQVCECTWGTLQERFQRQRLSGTALLWSVSLWKALFLWGRGKNWYLQASLEEPHLTSAPTWSRLFFIFTLYEANGICSWLTSNLEKWSSLGLQLAGLRLLVDLKRVRQQQVFSPRSRAQRHGYWGRVPWV